MSEIDNGGQAFPVQVPEYNGMPASYIDGMSLRDWFAGQALTALPPHLHELQTDHWIKIAEWSYNLADAMLYVRKGKP
jgi:hypothetical protein